MALTAFDPARYLREVADRTVDDPQRLRPTPTALLAAAQALVAVAQIDEAVAQHILDEHEEVLRRRDRNRSIAWTREWPTEPLAARRVLLGTDEEWWAEDDRGRRYLSTGHSSGGNASRGSGHVVFHAPLDPRARWIELQPTAETTRAVIHVPLD